MKNFTLAIVLFTSLLSFSQGQQIPCASDVVLANVIAADPDVKERLAHFESSIFETNFGLQRVSNINLPPASLTIPVVVYVVHDGTAAVNISDIQVNNQLTVMNNYFLNTGIQFCLATKVNGTTALPTASPSHIQNTPGIIHINSASLSNHASSSPAALMATAAPLITKDRYLRIWVVKTIDGTSSGILGYSMFPNTSPIFDGIVMRYDVFGNNDPNMMANYNLGKVLVHEVGHYLGLYHTFEGSCAAAIGDCQWDGDRVCDTPPVAAPNFNCLSGTNSCMETPDNPDDLSNYMDYGNNTCQNHFSQGQINRMLTVLSLSRSTLSSTENIIYTGTCGYDDLLSATITANDFLPCSSATSAVTFSAPPAATYQWDFGDPFATGLNPNTANTQSTSHIYTSSASSPYTVTLTVTDGNGDTKTSSELIYVTDCAPIANGGSYWYVDSSNGLDFSSGRAVFDPTFPIDNFANLTTSSQCDANGELLFYTNKFKVWNNQHVEINTTDLMLNTSTGSRSQVLIVPKPPLSGNTISEYYIFTKQISATAITADLGFYYSMVNVTGTTATMGVIGQPISLPSSYGFSANANTGALLGPSGLAAVPKCNSNDYWILTSLKKGTNDYIVVFSLSSGLAYVSEMQIVTGNPVNMGWEIEVAPNGNKLFLWHGGNSANASRIYDFNKAEGIISSGFTAIALPQTSNTYGQMFGASFSPDSNLLYAGDFYSKKIFQYNVNTIDIPNSRREVASTINAGPWDMELGPDNKLYVSMANMTNNYRKLSVIHNPNVAGTAANANACHFSINGPKPTNWGYRVGPSLPNLIDAKQHTAYFEPNTNNVISKYITACNTYKFFPNVCGTSFTWTFTNTTTGGIFNSAVTNPTYNFSQNGTYAVTLKSADGVVLGTTSLVISSAVAPTINGSSTACLTQVNANVTNNSTPLADAESAVWSITGGSGTITGPDNQSSVNINWTILPGTITLIKLNAAGCTVTETRTITAFCQNLAIDTFREDSIVIQPNPSQGLFTIASSKILGKVTIQVVDMQGRIVLKESGVDFINEKTVDLSGCQSGIYIIGIQGIAFSYVRKLVKN